MNSRSVALQGFGFGVTRIAVQGFGQTYDPVPDPVPSKMVGGRSKIRRQNEWVIRAVVIAITSGFLK